MSNQRHFVAVLSTLSRDTTWFSRMHVFEKLVAYCMTQSNENAELVKCACRSAMLTAVRVTVYDHRGKKGMIPGCSRQGWLEVLHRLSTTSIYRVEVVGATHRCPTPPLRVSAPLSAFLGQPAAL